MIRYTSRADLLIAAGESIKMQMNAGVNEPAVKYMGKITACDELHYTNPQLCEYEFPLAVVECRPVFAGDELWCEATKTTVREGARFDNNSWSWLPPKPKTVIVELTIEEAEYLAQYNGRYDYYLQIAEKTRKALEKA